MRYGRSLVSGLKMGGELDNAILHVTGVIRDRNLDKSSAITVLFSGPIGDTDLREFHEYVSKWRANETKTS
jgi:hypothetical protein